MRGVLHALLVRDAKDKQEFLQTLSVRERLLKLTRHISREIGVMELGSKIQKDVQDEVEKGQREFVLRQQLKAIQKELGEGDENETANQKLREEVEKAGMPPPAREAADRELNRLRTMPPRASWDCSWSRTRDSTRWTRARSLRPRPTISARRCRAR